MNILFVEDDLTLNKNITEILKSENYNVTSVFDGLLAERLLKKENYDCVILDVNLPGKNGFDLCENFRSYNKHTPVIILTAFSQLEDKVYGFNCGADDYLTKPFFMRELVLRVSALIKRSNTKNSSSEIIQIEDIIINQNTKKVTRQNVEIILTPREYQILIKLIESKGSVVSKTDLITKIWGKTFDSNTNTIEVYINFLRNKIDKPFGKNTIKTKVGYGYYLDFN